MNGLVVEGTYEDGVIKPDRPLPLKEHERVRFTILDSTQIAAALAAVERTYGLIPWTGDPEVLRQIAEEPEFGISESPWI
jgi:predicted DNA-binding antitoxin AbrB/MazE fold protein